MKQEVLFVLPKLETLNKYNTDEKREFKECVRKVAKYLNEHNCISCILSADETAKKLRIEEFQTKVAILPEDRFFIKTILGYEYPEGEINEISSLIYNKVRKKLPVMRGMTVEERKEKVEEREKAIAKEYVSQAHYIVDFSKKNNAQYKVKTKPGDKKIILTVDIDTMLITATLSGTPIDLYFLYKDREIMQSIYNWNK